MSDASASHGTYDPDEDLFNFDEVALEFYGSADEEDLEEIFAAFEDEDQTEVFPSEEEPAPQETLAAVAPALPSEPVGPTTVFETLAAEPTEPDEPSIEAFRAGAPSPAPDYAGAPSPAPEYSSPPTPPSAAPPPPLPAPAPVEAPPLPSPAPPGFEPHAPPVAPPVAPPTSDRLTTLLKGSPAILIAVTCLNALVAVVALSRTGGERPAAKPPPRVQPGETTFQPPPLRTPEQDVPLLTPTSPERHPTFVLALEEIGRGEYAAARRRIYGLLSIVDRLETADREAIEARAHFILAESLHLEALERLGSGSPTGSRP